MQLASCTVHVDSCVDRQPLVHNVYPWVLFRNEIATHGTTQLTH